MTTLYWIPAPSGFEDGGYRQRVIIEAEGDDVALTPEQKKALGKLDGLRGGPEGNRGEYIPVTAEQSAELRARATEDAKAS